MLTRLTFLFLLAVTIVPACGGKSAGKDDDADKRPVEYCNDACAEASECEGVPDNYLEDCEDSCLEIAQASHDADCLEEFEVVAKCGLREFDCEATGESCEDEADDFLACLF